MVKPEPAKESNYPSLKSEAIGIANLRGLPEAMAEKL
jgi:hypothetical protein